MSERHPLPTAPSHAFRRPRFLERAGERLRRVPAAPVVRRLLRHAYHATLMWQTGGRGLPCTLPGGEIVRALPEHRHLSWNRSEYDAFWAAVKPGMVALDVGANVGAYALLLGQWVGTGGAVYAFEPAPAAFDGLSRHIALNQLQGTVRPVMAAVGATETTAPLIVSGPSGESRLAADAELQAGLPAEINDGDDPSASGQRPAAAVGRTVATPVTTIDRFCACERIEPHFLKIDVEGWELAVLRGARETIRRNPRLGLFVEMHPSIWPLIGVARADILAELAAQSLVVEPLTPTDDVWALEGVCVRLRRA